MDIYIWKDGAESGPYSEQDIREAVASGSISPQQTARSSEGGDWLPLETLLSLGAEPIRSSSSSAQSLHQLRSLLSLGAEPIRSRPVRSRSIAETESPPPPPETGSPPTSLRNEALDSLKSPMAGYFRGASIVAFLGVCFAGILCLVWHFTVAQMLALMASSVFVGMLLQGMAEALDALHVIAERLHRIEKKK